MEKPSGGKRISKISMSRKKGLKSNKTAQRGGPKNPGPNYGRNAYKGSGPRKLW